MKNKVLTLFAAILMIVYVVPARAETIVQLWTCQLNEGSTQDELMAISVEWMNAVNAMDGLENFESYIEFPMATDNMNSFVFVMVADSGTNWGAFQDAYEGSAAAEVDERWGDVADCADSSLWNSVKIE